MNIIYKNTSFENLGEIGRKPMTQNSTNIPPIILTLLGITTGFIMATIILKYKNEKSKKSNKKWH